MRDFRATAVLERLSAFAKARRPSSYLAPELLARLSAFAKESRLSPLMLTALLAHLSTFAKGERSSPLVSRALLAQLSAFARAKRLSPLMLAALSLLSVTTTLSALFFLRALIGSDESAPSATPDWRPPSASFLNSPASAPPSTDVQTVTRPVFAKSRRPVPKVVAAPAPENRTGPPPALTVQAIVLSNGASRAYLVSQGGANGEWYLVGQLIDGWTISEMRASEVTLKSGERTAILSLYPETPPPGEGEAKGLPPSMPSPIAAEPRAPPPPRRR